MLAAVDVPPRTRYARNGETHLAYQVVGEGPLDILLIESWGHHVEASWGTARALPGAGAVHRRGPLHRHPRLPVGDARRGAARLRRAAVGRLGRGRHRLHVGAGAEPGR